MSIWNHVQGRRAAGASGDSRLRMQQQRKKWNDETAKRIHVAVRVRPMNINEIKADAKVRPSTMVLHYFRLDDLLSLMNDMR